MSTFIFEDNQSLNGKYIKIPKELQNHLQKTLTSYGNFSENDGYKRLNSILNADYNKKTKEQTPADSISYGNLKRIKHDMEAIPNQKSIEYQLNGGSEMYNWVNGTLKQQMNSVKSVNKVKKSNNISKSKLNPTKITDKGIKLPKTNKCNIQLEQKTKKIYITENQIKRLFENKNKLLSEYRNELYLPFDGNDSLHGKPCYVHFIDWMQYNGTRGNLNVSTDSKTVEDYYDETLDKAISDAFNFYVDLTNELQVSFCDTYKINNYKNFYNQNFIDKMLSFSTDDETYDFLYYCDLIGEDYLTPIGEKYFEAYKNNYVSDNLKLDYIDDIKTVDGLVLIYRALAIPNFEKNTTGDKLPKEQDYFEYLNEKYNGRIGKFWAYERSGAQQYCGDSLGEKDEIITLQGYVDPKDINWERSTTMKYEYPEEKELTIRSRHSIQINGFYYGDNKFYNLGTPIIMKA
jgi:hypothetical protein